MKDELNRDIERPVADNRERWEAEGGGAQLLDALYEYCVEHDIPLVVAAAISDSETHVAHAAVRPSMTPPLQIAYGALAPAPAVLLVALRQVFGITGIENKNSSDPDAPVNPMLN